MPALACEAMQELRRHRNLIRGIERKKSDRRGRLPETMRARRIPIRIPLCRAVMFVILNVASNMESASHPDDLFDVSRQIGFRG